MSPKFKAFPCTKCSCSYVHKSGLSAHVKSKHTIADRPKNPIDNLSKESENRQGVLIFDDAEDAELYNEGAKASQQTKISYANETINEIINNILVVAVEKDEPSNKVPIVPDDGWTRRTTGDLAALLDNIDTNMLPEAIECDRCDLRFTSKEELKQHESTTHGPEHEYEQLYRKHEKLTEKYTILNKANHDRLELIEENSRIRKVMNNTAKHLHKTRESNQVLDETVKIREMELNAMEEIVKKLRDEIARQQKEAEDKLEEKNAMIRSLEEELGVGVDDKEDHQTDNEGPSNMQNEWISEETRRHNAPIVKCKKCNFKTNDSVKMLGHMTKHEGYQCNKCDKTERTQGDLNHHIQTEHRPDLYTCTKCNKQFQAKNALKQHMNSQHPANPPVGHAQWADKRNQVQELDYCCNQCGNCFAELKQLREHKKNDHKGQTFQEFTAVKAQCHFYLQGRCNRNPCRFSHNQQQQQQQKQQQQKQQQQQQQQQQQTPACSRGQQCRFLAWGTCNFFHPGVGVQQPRQQKQQRPQNLPKKKCHFQENCWNTNCAFEHEDFGMSTDIQENY